MSKVTSHAYRLAVTATAATALTGLVGLAPASAAQTTNQNAGFVVVYDNNTENMIPASCEGNDFEKLFSYIKAQPSSPDVFTVQQVSGQTKLDALTKRMSDELPGTYASVIAIADPNPKDRGSGTCNKNQQTNAVIYRSDRFTAGSTIRWRADAPDGDNHDGSCRNLTATGFQDRVENVAVRLSDKVAKKDVTVASIHWPTNDPWNGSDCAAENITEARDRTASLGTVSLTVLGGDTNATVDKPTESPWGSKAKSYGFRDSMAEACGSTTCAPNTFSTRRIDFLLAKGGQGFANAVTLSSAAAGGKYSDHLALRADVKY